MARYMPTNTAVSHLSPQLALNLRQLVTTEVHLTSPFFMSFFSNILGADDDSDASSVCSISTCPGDLGFRGGTQYRPKMPTFPDISVRAVSEQPRSGPGQEQTQKTSLKTSRGQNYVIRSRPAGVYGPYMLCGFIKRKQPCFQGKLCKFAHSEEERIAWEEDRKKGT